MEYAWCKKAMMQWVSALFARLAYRIMNSSSMNTEYLNAL